jgi:hypothetical protein
MLLIVWVGNFAKLPSVHSWGMSRTSNVTVAVSVAGPASG